MITASFEWVELSSTIKDLVENNSVNLVNPSPNVDSITSNRIVHLNHIFKTRTFYCNFVSLTILDITVKTLDEGTT
jgi:hypothetical protein